MQVIQDIAQPYIAQSYRNAGIVAADWQPEKGFRANRAIMDKLYYYYQTLYFKNPEQFLWAGLARLTGGQVLFGMDNLVRIAKDPCVLTQQIVDVAKAIFESLAWQHELLLTNPDLLLQVCEKIDAAETAAYPYASCWRTILKGESSKGNKMLLHNEQLNTIQTHYDVIKQDRYSARYFTFTRFVMRNIHPHHRRFIFCYPFGDVTKFHWRWKWIEGEKGMWQTWASLPLEERNRLVALDNEAVIQHKW